MTDKELLELAAKAAGKRLEWITLTATPKSEAQELPFDGDDMWDPLADDGEALRLSAYLCMTVRHEDPNAVVVGWTAVERVPFTRDGMGPWFWKEWLRDHGNDRAATTRRAIVRAAAEVGRPAP